MSAQIKNVVVVNDFSYTQGGASKVAIDTANLLSEKLNVVFFCGDTSGGNELSKKVKVVSTGQRENLRNKNIVVGAKNGIYNNSAYKLLFETLNSLNDNTIVHVHGWTKVLSASVFQAIYDSGKPLIVTLHDYFTVCPNGGFYNYQTDEICNLCPMSKACRKCNCDSRNYLVKSYRVRRQEKQDEIFKKCESLKNVIVISDFSRAIFEKYLPSDTNYFKVLNPIGKYSESEDKKSNKDYYVFVGRVSKEKGPEIFCEAIKRAGKKGIAVGDGPLTAELSECYPEIQFVGWKNSKEVRKYMSDAKALIFPSKWYETAGLTVLEAQSVGTPCIVSSKNAGSEFVKDGLDGLIYDGSVDDLVAAIARFEKSDVLSYRKKAKLAFSNYMKKENYVEKILLVYNTILSRKGNK